MAPLGLFSSKEHPFKLVGKPEVNYIRSYSLDTFLTRSNKFYKDCGVEKSIKAHQPEYNRVNEKAG